MSSVDFYRVLNVSRNASIADIKASYRRLAMKFHPDQNRDNKEQASAKFNTIHTAYQTLANAGLKSAYDQSIGNSGSHSWQGGPTYRTGPAPNVRYNVRRVHQPVRPEHFDVKLWNVWHYGDDPEKWPVFGGESNKDSRAEDATHAYYRANRREHEEATMRAQANMRCDVVNKKWQSKDVVMDQKLAADTFASLRKKREERHQAVSSDTNSHGSAQRTVSSNNSNNSTSHTNNSGEAKKEEEKSSGCCIS